MPEPKGELRPRILALDWNQDLDVATNRFKSIIAIGSISRTRIFARFDDNERGKKWKMMARIYSLSSVTCSTYYTIICSMFF